MLFDRTTHELFCIFCRRLERKNLGIFAISWLMRLLCITGGIIQTRKNEIVAVERAQNTLLKYAKIPILIFFSCPVLSNRLDINKNLRW